MYTTLRNIHLLCGSLALAGLLMYGLSAVQMAHPRWFVMKPAVTESRVLLGANESDGRRVARELALSGEITAIQQTPSGFDIRIAVPGTVHEVKYDRATGEARIRTSIAGFMGMLNRLHHLAGLWHDYTPSKLWAVLVLLVSLATVVLGASGIWLWWLRRQERTWGLVFIAANLIFSIGILIRLRSMGP
jgi:hypothetical protein